MESLKWKKMLISTHEEIAERFNSILVAVNEGRVVAREIGAAMDDLPNMQNG